MQCLRMWKVSIFVLLGTFIADIVFKLSNLIMAALLGFGTGILLTSVICMYDIKGKKGIQ
jgi:uncharacterized transporter YbjL